MPYFEPREYPFAIELGAGPFFSPEMGRKYSNGFASVEFYDGPVYVTDKGNIVTDAANIVVPTAGELEVELTESDDKLNGNYGDVVNGTIDATDPAYLRPNWGGATKFMRVTESVAVIGATHAVVKILRT
jgi:hypothetical protein